jgi:hypothetical protein
MAYQSNDAAQIALNIKFDNAVQTAGASATRTVVSQTPGQSVN